MDDLLEYVSLQCPFFTAKGFHRSFVGHLPREYFSLTESEAATQLKSDMVALLGSEDLFNELSQDCG